MSRARQQRNRRRAAAAVQFRTAVATTGTVPMDHTADIPIYAALAAVLAPAPYDPADAEFTAWPGYPGPQPEPAPPALYRPAWAASTGQIRRVDAAIQALGGTPRDRAVAVHALTVTRAAAGEPPPAPPTFMPPPMPLPAPLPAGLAARRRRAGEARHAA